MKRNYYRITAMLLTLFLVTMLVAACGSKSDTNKNVAGSTEPADSQSASASGEPQKAVTLSLLANKDHWTLGTQAIVDAFNAKGTGITVEVEVLPGGNETDNIMKTRLATGEAPDIFQWLSGAKLNDVAPEQNFEDLSAEAFMSNVDESFKSVMSLNGKVYGIPGSPAQFGVWFYNKKVYDELSLKAPKTWAELMDNSEKIKAAGKTAIIAPYKDAWTSQLIVLADHYNVKHSVPTLAADLTANKVKLQDVPEYVRSWEKLQEVFTKGYISKDALSMSYDTALKMLAEGTGVQFPMGSWMLDALVEKYPDQAKDIGSFVQPSDDASVNGITLWMPEGLMMSKQSENKDSVRKFLDFYVSKEGTDAFMSKQKPAGPFLVKGITLPDDVLPAVKDAVQYIDNGAANAALEFESPIKPTSFEKITILVAAGFKTPLEGVKMTDAENEKYAKLQKLAGW
ncbi:sugar ABC transporter substrate-binding protein [Paenibacillus baekrokdamisoli]|uniref:Sugar ABC transporter substrate-binding protein n=1 Tax=Paenibacillus baekrokdamisoli TaxID=1712516 RepID=A0A3G9IRQ4_9BACL|nr:extracellular solute-binding protein [Paenibacillus baekrokdamisoli]MBB3071122.1 raffinose/stachyose/melibiose transport system substrate-binding protein [Paenibacillus baekrokdamisoli]BBH21540.1 sugar ABC transporter substrate-binding protein [Paenibacillus baekrokdamisoli]